MTALVIIALIAGLAWASKRTDERVARRKRAVGITDAERPHR